MRRQSNKDTPTDGTATVGETGNTVGRNDFLGLIETYRAVLQKLEAIAYMIPNNETNQQRIDHEERILLLQNDLIVRRATRKTATSLTEVLQKLELWKMNEVGVGRDAEDPGDQLVLSIIEDIETLAN